jgi:hypothetical protein
LELFLKVTNMDENEFYNIISEHVVSPNIFPTREKLDRNSSNIKLKDLDTWINKFS